MPGLGVQVEHPPYRTGLRAQLHGGVGQRQRRVDDVFPRVFRVRDHGEPRGSRSRIVPFHPGGKRNILGGDLDVSGRVELVPPHPVDTDTVLGAVSQTGIRFGRRHGKVQRAARRAEGDAVEQGRNVGGTVEVQSRPRLGVIADLHRAEIEEGDRFAKTGGGVPVSVVQEGDVLAVGTDRRIDGKGVQVGQEGSGGGILQDFPRGEIHRCPPVLIRRRAQQGKAPDQDEKGKADSPFAHFFNSFFRKKTSSQPGSWRRMQHYLPRRFRLYKPLPYLHPANPKK